VRVHGAELGISLWIKECRLPRKYYCKLQKRNIGQPVDIETATGGAPAAGKLGL
jgi:hypothetical protein